MMASVTPYQLDCLAHATQMTATFTNFAQGAALGIVPFNPDAAFDALTQAMCSVLAGFDEDPDDTGRPQVIWGRQLTRALAGWHANDDGLPPVGAA